MLKQKRFKIILEEVGKSGSATYQDLANILSVSEDTIRRDIKELEGLSLLSAVRGGAIGRSRIPHHYRDRERTDIAQKKVIAQKAINLIKDGQVLFFDGGTSTLELAKILPQDSKLTIITNSFPVANVLEDHPSAELIFLGGRLSKTAFATYGHETLVNITKFRADLYFFGVTSITQSELSCIDLEDAETKRLMIQQSLKIVGLCTLDKINSQSNYFIDSTHKLDILISEEDPNVAILQPYKTIGIELM